MLLYTIYLSLNLSPTSGIYSSSSGSSYTGSSPYTVLLRNGMHGVAIFHDVNRIPLRSFLFLTFQINDITRLQRIILMQVIVLHKLLPTDIELLAQ